jgi:hypothetical protein
MLIILSSLTLYLNPDVCKIEAGRKEGKLVDRVVGWKDTCPLYLVNKRCYKTHEAIKILNMIYNPVFYLKHDVSETELCLSIGLSIGST